MPAPARERDAALDWGGWSPNGTSPGWLLARFPAFCGECEAKMSNGDFRATRNTVKAGGRFFALPSIVHIVQRRGNGEVDLSAGRRSCLVIFRDLLFSVLMVFAASACKDSRWTPGGSAELVLSEIQMGGAANVARRIDTDESFGRSVMNGIATGDSAWLAVAEKLTPTSATAEASFSIALASALPRSPEKVLAVLGTRYAIEDVCGIPFLRPDSTLVASYHGEAVAALSRVRSTALAKVRDECRTTLDAARTRRLERIDPSYTIKNKPAPLPRRRR